MTLSLLLTASLALDTIHVPSESTNVGRGDSTVPLFKKGRFYEVELTAFGGEAGCFVLDTGGSRSYLTPKGLARFKSLGAPTKRGEPFLATSVTLGKFSVPPFEFVLDKKAGRASLDPNASGVIGADALSSLRVGLDLRSRTMRLWPAELPIASALRDWYEPAAPDKTVALPFWSILGGLFGTTLNVNGHEIGATVDTGSEVSLIDARFQGGAFEGLNKLGEYPVRFYTGPARVESFDAEGVLRLGEITLLGKRTIGRTQTPEGAGSILGCDVLGDLRLLLDFPGHQMYAQLKTIGEPEF